jgi:hypothetical protein
MHGGASTGLRTREGLARSGTRGGSMVTTIPGPPEKVFGDGLVTDTRDYPDHP